MDLLMEKQKHLALGFIIQSILMGLFNLESYLYANVEFFCCEELKAWIFLRFLNIVTLVYISIISVQLRPLFSDKHYKNYSIMMVISLILTIVFNLVTLIGVNYTNDFIINRNLGVITLSFHYLGMVLSFFIQSFGMIFFAKLAKKLHNKRVFGVSIAASITFFFFALLSQIYTIPFSLDILNILPYYPGSFLDNLEIITYFISFFAPLACFIPVLIFGIILLRFPLMKSEIRLTQRKCIQCHNFINKTIKICPYCGILLSS
jgi:hypothetical protein